MGACQPSAHDDDDLHTSIPLINVSVEICRAWPSFRFRLAKIHKCGRKNAFLQSPRTGDNAHHRRRVALSLDDESRMQNG